MQQAPFDLVVHATHEAGFKVGGIGALLDGLLASNAYQAAVRRTVLVGAMDTGSPAEMARLAAPDNRLEIIYSSWHRVDEAPEELSRGLQAVEARTQCRLLYGRRAFGGACHEVLLVDARQAYLDGTNQFKRDLWQQYRLQSDRYEWNEEFDRVMRAARPAYAGLSLLVGQEACSRFLIAHDWMGLPLAYCVQMADPDRWRLVFYAHEMATARILVEDHPGHDTRFYNVLRLARSAGLTLDQLFGDRSDFFKHALVKQAVHLHKILTVGQWVREELRFLGGPFATAEIDLVYNGVPLREMLPEERTARTARLQAYGRNLLGFTPDYVFSHVTRLVISKGLWRDLRVLEQLDPVLARDGKTAVLFMLASGEPAGRPAEEVLRWEAEYGWPVTHRQQGGDLVGHEAPLYRAIEGFNSRSQAVKIVLVNQYGWSRERCGSSMPEEMTFDDLRWGTQLEFGQSAYEPFGIAQVEPLASGALLVASNVCGCVGFVEQAARQAGMAHFTHLIQADYTTLADGLQVYSPWDALWINREVRHRLEKSSSYSVALAIRTTLPATERQSQALLNRGQRVAQQMSWEVVAADYLIPALERAAGEG